MKSLNELTPKERLELYKKARVDWTERPNDEDACTDWGLCGYFEDAHGIDALACRKKEWEVHVLQQIGKNGRYIFLGEIGDPVPRIAALNAMIKELEDLLNNQKMKGSEKILLADASEFQHGIGVVGHPGAREQLALAIAQSLERKPCFDGKDAQPWPVFDESGQHELESTSAEARRSGRTMATASKIITNAVDQFPNPIRIDNDNIGPRKELTAKQRRKKKAKRN